MKVVVLIICFVSLVLLIDTTRLCLILCMATIYLPRVIHVRTIKMLRLCGKAEDRDLTSTPPCVLSFISILTFPILLRSSQVRRTNGVWEQD